MAIRVLVIDDSAYLRKMLSHMLRQSPLIEVVGAARDGLEGLDKVLELKPDVVTLDLNLPNLNGVEFLRAQMARQPLAVVVVSIASEDGELAGEAIELGAVEFVSKPTGLASERVLDMQRELIEKVLAAAAVPRHKLLPAAGVRAAGSVGGSPKQMERLPCQLEAVVVGMSTGGPQALRYLLDQLPEDLRVPVAVVLHMPFGYTGPFARKLDKTFALEVCEARSDLPMPAGRLILAQAGRHLRLRRSLGQVVCALDAEPSDSSHRPSVDVLFQSAAKVYGPKLLAVVMTGMGIDGTAGSACVKASGGRVLVESESSCVVYGMPRSVVEAGLADDSQPLNRSPELS